MDKLDKKQRKIARNWSRQPNDTDKAAMREAYSWLRATLESIIERVVFADVVFRYRSYINVKKLRKVIGFPTSECDELLRLYKRCCDVTEAHDAASGKQAPVPEPGDLHKDIKMNPRWASPNQAAVDSRSVMVESCIPHLILVPLRLEPLTLQSVSLTPLTRINIPSAGDHL